MPRRRPLSNIPINISTRQELSSDAKNKIYGRALAGQSAREIEAAECVPKSTIDGLLQRVEQRNTTNNLPRSGQPKIYTERDKRRIIFQVRLSPKITYNELRRINGFQFSYDTIRTILNNHGIINWRSKRRPALTEAVAATRLAFARA